MHTCGVLSVDQKSGLASQEARGECWLCHMMNGYYYYNYSWFLCNHPVYLESPG